ncbi:MAG: hypothetical protein K6G88_06280 [Lachnospiraceae bacterium]|nr:hypothetical protein [Lachnospiraceae bacterium]
MSKFSKIMTLLITITLIFSNNYLIKADSEKKVKVVQTEDIDKIISYLYYYDCDLKTQEKSVVYLNYLEEKKESLLEHSCNLLFYYRSDVICEMPTENYINNIEVLSQCLIIDYKKDKRRIEKLLSLQNSDGGFGLAKNYESDILDTKIALKALQVLGETDAMTNAARYIFSNQNKDGGFGYQPGLKSNAELTADIANILADCINDEMNLKTEFSAEIAKLRSYLDKNAVSLTNLSSDKLENVYQHFNTALFKLKMDSEYDVSEYYDLQAEDGSVFADPLATAMYLELMVREQNTIKASIDDISFTTDEGENASIFNSDENVNITVNSSFNPEEGYLTVSVVTPDGEVIDLDNEALVFNTADYPNGSYRVVAKVINSFNNEVAAKYSNMFTVNKAFAAEELNIAFYNADKESENYGQVIQVANKGDSVKASLRAAIDLKNADEVEGDLVINWHLMRKTKEVKNGVVEIGEDSIDSIDSIVLDEVNLDTTEACTYVLEAEITAGETVVKNAITTFIVSGQEMAVLTNADKDELVAAKDSANVSVKIREKKTVDLVLATGTEDAQIANKYADKIEEIKKSLEKLGYSVNVGATKSTHYTAKDTFAWQEYDHIDYIEPKTSYAKYNIPKHILYENDGIRMIGYCYEANKDFLYLEGNNETKKVLEFDVKKEDGNNWHTIEGAGFLFNTSIKDNTIEGYCVLLRSGGLYLYKIRPNDLTKFRNGKSNSKTTIKSVSVKNTSSEHHIKLVVENNLASVYDNDNLVMENINVGEVEGDGYGPIIFHSSHNCSQISSFRFSNISMKAIGGKKFEDIISSYNFESYDSRYIINVSDSEDENIVNDADRIINAANEKNITMLTVGNDTNREAYGNLYKESDSDEGASSVAGKFYELSDDTTLDQIEQYIISNEESKYVVNENGNKATDLVFTGTLYDGSVFTKKFEHLYEGEQINFNIPQTMEGLKVGKDAPVLKDITLTFTDAIGKRIAVPADDIYLPVVRYTENIADRLTSDDNEYMQYNNAQIEHRVYNNSDKNTAKNLVSVISIKDSQGNVVKTYSKELDEIMVSGYIDHAVTWNTAESEAGEYTIEASVYDGSYLVTHSTKTVAVEEIDASYVDISGNVTLSKKILKNTDELVISKAVKNEFKNRIENAKEIIRIVNAETNDTVYESEISLSLDGFEKVSSTETVIAIDDFSYAENGEYYICHEALLEDGRIIPLEGDGFILDTKKKPDYNKIFGDGALISLNNENETNGIELDGAIITVGGTMHSNTNIEVNTSILNISNTCEAVLPVSFNAVVTNIANGTRVCGAIDTPETDAQIADEDIFIESPIYDNYANGGTLLASNGNITIRSSYARFKGLIYAPNGTVTIESSTFNMEGRIIAKNIVYKGSVLNVSSYDGDLDFLK